MMTRLITRTWQAGWGGLQSDLTAAVDRSRGRRVRRRERRFGRARFLTKVGAGLFAAMVMLDATAAIAADSGSAGNVWFNWLSATDSFGNRPSAYDLRVKQGGISDPIKALGAFLLGWFWDMYRLAVSLMVWAFQFVLEFKFLEVVRVPANTVAQVIQDVTTQLGIIPLVAVVAVAVSGFRLLKGAYGAGFGEIAVTTVVVALLSTALANPVGLITGDDGLLVKARDTGASLTTDLLHPKDQPRPSVPVNPNDPDSPDRGGSAGDYTPAVGNPQDTARDAMTRRMLDTFVRTPHQLLNFGLFIDQKEVDPNSGSATTGPVDTSDAGRTHPDCFNAYNKAFGKAGGSVNDMTKGSTCPQVVKDSIEHPDRSLVGAWMVAWAVFWTLMLGLLLLVASAFLIGLAAWEAAKFALSLIRSIMPGADGGRESAATGAATMIVASFLAMLSVVMIGVYLITLNAVFNATAGWNPVVVYIFIDLVAIAFIIGCGYMLFRARKAGKKLGSKAASAITPKGTPRAILSGSPRVGAAISHARKYAQSRAITRAAGNTADRRDGQGSASTDVRGTPQAIGRGRPKSVALATGALKGAKYAAMYTVGAPVAIPKAAAATKVGGKAALNQFKASAKDRYRNGRASAVAAGNAARESGAAYAREWAGNAVAPGVWAAKNVTPGGRAQLRQDRESRRQPAVSSAQRLVDLQERIGRPVDPQLRQRAQQANEAVAVSRRTRFQHYEQQAEQRRAAKVAASSFAQRPGAPSAVRNQQLRTWMEHARSNSQPIKMPTGSRK